MSGIIEKAKDTLGHHKAKHDTQHGSTNAGPHNSNAANKLDPSVDSDLDGRENPGTIIGGYKQGTAGGPYSGSTFGTAGSGAAQSTAGPHDTDFMNKADPRVDSDKDHSMTMGADKTNA
ncbi:hypothetical protein LTR99_001155 [Exophiala xenobiotica]|uniref:Uncharacterized protein n=1 Tax=Vermiconidia calcicola TaxID=1690605 RepID=A0AAV9QMI5_9PEZI|nr:hypothetical protein LTR96_003515 [Exophiala xenobiotica]KAK5545717.1 hypothetical protein LTR25_000725 [Vermiconidia calcicola]KAK5550023.1 hypothetical protein LTR23_000316 [Chaetothyriales sp. CCFEE 6169]KAK5308182.1 hypothetical protein LTR99_001155 [Exophiala xenobiotica]KAK5342923.1 hypothetical protein LTR98_000551 [Exophiala xenobiotica]